MVIGDDPMDRDVTWHKVYNLLRDHGQKGMPLQALSGVDIALWDIAGKVAGLPIHKLIGGAHRTRIPAYGYGMMLKRESLEDHIARFGDEAAGILDMGFRSLKMKVGLGPRADVKLCEAVAAAVAGKGRFMVDANHCYTTADAFHVGRALEELGAYWFEEPVAPEDLEGYRELRAGLKVNISGGEAEYNRWGWRRILENRGLDIAQPEVCALGGNQRIPSRSGARARALHAGRQSCLGFGYRRGLRTCSCSPQCPRCLAGSIRASRCWNSTRPTTYFGTNCCPSR